MLRSFSYLYKGETVGKRILIIGSGAREHAMAWKLWESKDIDQIYVAPGNAGSSLIATNVPIDAKNITALRQFARENVIDLTIVGPEGPLESGIVNSFQDAGLRIFGPTSEAAAIETSKAYAKKVMKEYGIPTAPYRTFLSRENALIYVRTHSYPLVVKADGLAQGKGVVICKSHLDAVLAIEDLMVKGRCGDAGRKIVIEEFLDGDEVSVHVLTDGYSSVMLPTSQDHKELTVNGKVHMTGGMGCIAPVPWIGPRDLEKINHSIIQPMLAAMRDMGTPFKGCLFVGLIMTKNGPSVLEFNARFGDPETTVLLPIIRSDFLALLEACVDGTLKDWGGKQADHGYAASIVLASKGYPGSYETGYPIEGLEPREGIEVFHAGTTNVGGNIRTAGGRVLTIMSHDNHSLSSALTRAYDAVKSINFKGMHYRTDIGDMMRRAPPKPNL